MGAEETTFHTNAIKEREQLLSDLDAEKHERNDLEVQLLAARKLQKESDAALRKAAEEKENELQRKIIELGANRLRLKKQLEQTIEEMKNERNIADETIAAEKERQQKM